MLSSGRGKLYTDGRDRHRLTSTALTPGDGHDSASLFLIPNPPGIIRRHVFHAPPACGHGYGYD
jgi:hypothetical protein